jgi:heptosyltransferase-2
VRLQPPGNIFIAVDTIESIGMSTINTIELFIKQHLKPSIFKSVCAAGRLIAPLTKKTIPAARISKILIVQGGGIGDAIRIFPLLETLAEARPDASVSILSPFDQRVFSLCPSVETLSELIIFDPAKQHRSFAGKISLARKLRQKSFDLIICPQIGLGMIELAALSFIIGAPYRIGYDMNGSGFLYTTRIPLLANRSIYDQHLDLLIHSGITKSTHNKSLQDPSVSVPEQDIEFAYSFFEKNGITDNDLVFTISPVVMADRDNKSPQHDRPLAESRSWPEEYYRELIQRILQYGSTKVIVLGDSISQGVLSDLLERADIPGLISAISKTTIAQSAGLIKLSHIFIGNDTGMLHVAAALKKRCIGIFGSTSPEQVMPPADQSIFLWKRLTCSPCFFHQPVPDFLCSHDIQCLTSLSVEEVMEAVTTLSGNAVPSK